MLSSRALPVVAMTLLLACQNCGATNNQQSPFTFHDEKQQHAIFGANKTMEMENGIESKRVKMDKGSLFGHLDIYPPDPIFHVKDAFLADTHANKVNLGIGGVCGA